MKLIILEQVGVRLHNGEYTREMHANVELYEKKLNRLHLWRDDFRQEVWLVSLIVDTYVYLF